MSSTFRAIKSSQMDYQGDFTQQGGCLIVGPGAHTLHYFHIDKHARDHVPINHVLQLVGIGPVDFKKEAAKNSQILKI
jgi:hypothetical protein